jgi:tetratricopeptide (TPR) repeat protein
MEWLIGLALLVAGTFLWMKGGPVAWFYGDKAAKLDAQCRYTDAIPLYEKAVRGTPKWLGLARTANLLRMGLAHYNDGQPAETLRRAEEALASRPPKEILHMAHVLAGLAHVELGDLERAEFHRQEAYNLAEKLGNRDQAAEYLAQLANVKMLRGNLGEAVATTRYAAQMGVKAKRMALLVEAECHRAWGDWNEARRAAQEARTVGKLPGAMEARSQGTIILLLAWIEAESGNVYAARQHFEAGRGIFERDEKIRLWCDATNAWLLALEHQREAASEALAAVAGQLEKFAGDRSTQSIAGAMSGYAAYELREYHRAREWWEYYLRWTPHPVFQVTGAYHLGECLLRSGETAAAAAAFRRAVSFGLDTHRARQAQKRLAALAALSVE